MKKTSAHPKKNQFEIAMSCRLPRGIAENYERLEAMRKGVMFCMTIATTDPYLIDSAQADGEIQKVADRLKLIRSRRARAIKNALGRGWHFVETNEPTYA